MRSLRTKIRIETAPTRLLDLKFEEGVGADESFQYITGKYFAYAGGRAGKDQVADVDGEIFRDGSISIHYISSVL